MKTFMYYLALTLGAPFAFMFFKMKVSYEGEEKFKIPKGAILISPHKHFLDAIAIAYLFFFRRLYFLAADWYHGVQIIFKPFMLLLGAVLVDIKGERYDFIIGSRKVLSKKKSLLVFPEGDYVNNKNLFEFGKFKTGYLLIALETGAPIVPIVSDFSYGLFSRLHFKIGKPIYVSLTNNNESSKEELYKLNKIIKEKCLNLFYSLKKEKASKIKMTYKYKEINKGDVIRVKTGIFYHYGVYLNNDNVIEFGHIINKPNEKIDIHLTSLNSFSGDKIPEVRVLPKRIKTRSIEDIENYLNEVIGQENYSLKDNNCLDLANRLTLKI